MAWKWPSTRAHQRPEPPRQEGRAPQVVSDDIGCHVDQAADLQSTAEAVSHTELMHASFDTLCKHSGCILAYGITTLCICLLSPVTVR